MNNKIEDGIINNLKQTRNKFDNTLNHLDYSSKILALDGSIGNKLLLYNETDDIMFKYELQKEIRSNIELLHFNNPNLGIIFYYLKDNDKAIFDYMRSRDDFSLKSFPRLAKQKGVRFFGPHQSVYKGIENTVLSIAREVEAFDTESYVYIESGFDRFDKLLNDVQYGLEVQHILINDTGEIVYSEDQGILEIGQDFKNISERDNKMYHKGYYLFEEKSKYGWQIITAIKSQDYNKAVNNWFESFFVIALISVLGSIFFAVIIWRMINKPLNILHNEIGLISEKQFDSTISYTNVQEFDELLYSFQYMRERILNLISEVKENEKRKSNLEVEMLMHQINPHFLHNTLNSIQWLAKMNGQSEIDKIIRQLTRLLHYNLGKDGNVVSIFEEIEAAKTYLKLLKIRYEYQYSIIIDADEDQLKNIQMPRFILQPLVENCLFHGLEGDEGKVEVLVKGGDNVIQIIISDNGKGMNREKIRDLMYNKEHETNTKIGLGIGLNYVQRMLKSFYGTVELFKIESEVGKGTKFIIEIPKNMELRNQK
jgi:two-component system sensor histidine kinase YesM